jgi:hypothetical protein
MPPSPFAFRFLTLNFFAFIYLQHTLPHCPHLQCPTDTEIATLAALWFESRYLVEWYESLNARLGGCSLQSESAFSHNENANASPRVSPSHSVPSHAKSDSELLLGRGGSDSSSSRSSSNRQFVHLQLLDEMLAQPPLLAPVDLSAVRQARSAMATDTWRSHSLALTRTFYASLRQRARFCMRSAVYDFAMQPTLVALQRLVLGVGGNAKANTKAHVSTDANITQDADWDGSSLSEQEAGLEALRSFQRLYQCLTSGKIRWIRA